MQAQFFLSYKSVSFLILVPSAVGSGKIEVYCPVDDAEEYIPSSPTKTEVFSLSLLNPENDYKVDFILWVKLSLYLSLVPRSRNEFEKSVLREENLDFGFSG